MDEYLIQKDTLSNIADSIRAKNGTDEKYSPEQMAEAIAEITTGVDTSDATITAMDIPAGEVGYGKDGKIIGDGVFGYNGIVRSSYNQTSPLHLLDVAYGNGRYVAINKTDYNAISVDGINWEPLWLPYDNLGHSVGLSYITYINGKFFVTGGNSASLSYLLCSEDGLNWNIIPLPKSTYWTSIAYGNGMYVITGNGTNVAYSTDGVTWKLETMPVSTRWCSVAYGNGRFVAIGGYNSSVNYTAYSDDGIHWKQETLSSSAYWNKIVYGNGRFVVCPRQNTTNIIYSENGINWAPSTLPSSSVNAYSMIYAQDKFVALQGTGVKYTVLYSYDGETWYENPLPANNFYYGITYGDNKFVAVGGDGKSIYSTDGINWMSGTGVTFGERRCYAYNVIYAGNKFVSNYKTGYLSYSYDGLVWNYLGNIPETNGYWSSPVYGKDLIVLTGKDEDENGNIVYKVAYSTDGVSWSTNEISDKGGDLINLCYCGDLFFSNIEAEDSTSKIAYSQDGITWKTTTVSTSFPLDFGTAYLAYGNGVYVLLTPNKYGDSGGADYCFYSTNGTSWTKTTLPSADYWDTIVGCEKGFVAFNYSHNTGIYSKDGKSWIPVNFPFEAYSIVYGNGKFIISNDTSNILAYSTDGSNWTPVDSIPFPVHGIVYGGGKFVAMGSIYSTVSVDGIHWSYESLPDYGIRKDISNGITISADGCKPQPLYKKGSMLALGDYAGSLTFTGTYANATYFTESGCSLAVDPVKGMAFVTIQGGSSTTYENILFNTVKVPEGVTFLQTQSSTATGTVGRYYVAAFTGITGKINVVAEITGASGTYTKVNLTMTYV